MGARFNNRQSALIKSRPQKSEPLISGYAKGRYLLKVSLVSLSRLSAWGGLLVIVSTGLNSLSMHLVFSVHAHGLENLVL